MPGLFDRSKILFVSLLIFHLLFSHDSADCQDLWQQQHAINVDLNAIQMFFYNGDIVGYVAGSDNYVARLYNFGKSLQVLNVPDSSVNFYDLHFVNPSTGWVAGSQGAVFATDDTGVSWEYRNQKSGGGKYFTSIMNACYFLNIGGGYVGWVGGSNGELWRTSDGGGSWSLDNYVSGGGSITRTIYDIDFYEASLGYCVTRGGEIYRTQTLGGTWYPESSNTTEWLLAVSIDPGIAENMGWIAGRGGTILRSSALPDGWTNVAPPALTINLNGISVLSEDEVYIVGEAGLVLHTTDSGQGWQSFQLGTGSLNDVFGLSEDHVWIVGDGGANYYSLGEVRFVSRLTPQDTLWGGETFDIIFSAPFNSKVNVSFQSEPGAVWEPIVQNHPSTVDSVRWTVPDTINSHESEARLRISSAIPGKNLSDMMAFKIFVDDKDPPVISDLAIPYQPSKGNELTIDATIEDLHDVSAALWYRPGGSNGYSQKSMTVGPLNPTRFQGVIDGHEVTINGIEYYIEAQDLSVHRNTGYFRDSTNPEYIEIYTDSEDFHIPASKPGSEIYRMISIPLVLESKEISQVLEAADVLGPYDKRKWRLFRWDAAANQGEGGYREYEESLSETTFEPGRAFWLVSDNGQLKTGRGHSVASVNNTIVLPDSGWHQVANPFQYAVPVDTIDFDPLLSGFYLYNPGSNDYDLLGEGGILEPYNGYFIRSDADNLSIVIPPVEAPAVGKSAKKHGNSLDWQIIMHVRCEGTKGPALMFGQSSRACNYFDRLDRLAVPPPSDRSINSYIPHPDWPSFKGNYRADVRSLNEDGGCWDFDVESFIDGIVELTFDLDGRIPEDARVFLMPAAGDFPQNLKEYSHFQYFDSGTGEARRFRLIVGSEEFMNRNVALLQPEQFTLFQNHPNPFNASTTIRYALPAPSRVSLKIFNVLGEEIALLLDDELKGSGYHVEIWNGRNKCGLRVSSGVYFYQLKAGQSSYTKKMLLIK